MRSLHRVSPNVATNIKQQVVFVRHGQSASNHLKMFTGWADVDLTNRGTYEAKVAGQILRREGYDFDIAYSSLLQRAIKTYFHMSQELDNCLFIPHVKHWRLNERHYGALEGLKKVETVEKFGKEQVKMWRRSFDVAPPKLAFNDPRHPKFDRKYHNIPSHDIPTAESLECTIQRVLPYWYGTIQPQVEQGARVVVVGHGNALRGLIKHLSGMDHEEILNFEIPTACPLVYNFDSQMRPLTFNYLLEAHELKERLADYKEQVRTVDEQIQALINH